MYLPTTNSSLFLMFYLVDCNDVINTMPETSRNRIEGWIDARNFLRGEESHFDDSEKGFIKYTFFWGWFFCIAAV